MQWLWPQPRSILNLMKGHMLQFHLFFCISKDCLYELPFSVKTLVNKCISNAVVNHVHNDTWPKQQIQKKLVEDKCKLIDILHWHASYICSVCIAKDISNGTSSCVLNIWYLYQIKLSLLFKLFPSRLKTARLSDERCNRMNEILSGVRVVKISTWELSFSKIINNLRRWVRTFPVSSLHE